MEKTNVTKLTKELTKALKDKPDYIRKGQFVFNYIETVYGVASVIQFEDKIDCFYDDSKIPDFILACIKRINNQNRIKMEEKLIKEDKSKDGNSLRVLSSHLLSAEYIGNRYKDYQLVSCVPVTDQLTRAEWMRSFSVSVCYCYYFSKI